MVTAVREDLKTVFNALDRLFNFIESDENIKKAFQRYVKPYSNNPNFFDDLPAFVFSFILEEKLDDKRVLDIYFEKNPDLSDEDREITEALENSVNSIFEVKRIMKNGFELYNLVNEKTYQVLAKTLDFRNILQGYYLFCRILKYKNKYFFAQQPKIISSKHKEEALKTAVTMQLEKPERLYEDNNDKLAEIEQSINDIKNKFKEYFKRDEVITTTQYVDDLLSDFNDYIENNSSDFIDKIDDLIKEPEKYAYFEVKEVINQQKDLSEVSQKGFSSHEKIYDVGILFDENYGLLVLPFYGTFKQIFTADDYKSIEGYEDCILNYFESPKIPPTPILNVYNNNKNRFEQICTEVLKLNESTDIQDVLKKYKNKYLERKVFSPPTILYLSKAFNEMMEVSGEKALTGHSDKEIKVGRNEPCHCGSGKKYKKCCLK